MEFTSEKIAQFLQGTVEGPLNTVINKVAKIEEADKNSLVFLSNPKYEEWLYKTAAGIVIINKTLELKQPVSTTIIRVDDAYASFAKILELYNENLPKKTDISKLSVIRSDAKVGENCYVGEFAVIESGAVIGADCQIYPHVYIGDNVKIGDNCTLYSGAKIYHDVVMGNNVTIHSGAVIGADGFGFAPKADGTYSKIPQIGNVVISDNVEIGANTCVDRATMGSTFIKEGVKLDNLIQIAHNVIVDEHCVLAAQVGIAGSSKIGKRVMMGGQVGVIGHISIADGIKMGSKSGAFNSLKEENGTYVGTPALHGSQDHRITATLKHLPDMRRELIALSKEVEILKNDKS